MSDTHTQLDTPALKVGDKLSQFEVMEQLGGGGSSVVWKAYDSLLDRYVAVKQLLVSPDQEEHFHARFRQEAALLKQLSEQELRLVKTVEHIDDERGAFIITEYVDGLSLDQLLNQNGEPSSVRGAMRILYALTQAMQTIHGAGVIHRDLKPSNILLPREGGLKICDLGLAALIAEQEALTLGSARYMAPELFRGEQADGRADIYSVGLILYEMLAGRTKFEQTFKTVMRDQRNQAMRWMKWHTNARMTAPPLKQQNAKVPTRLSDLIGRMMEKDPAKRVGSADELMQAIERHFSVQQHGAGATMAGSGATEAGNTEPAGDTTGDTAVLPQRRVWPWAVGGSAAALTLGAVLFAIFAGGSGDAGPTPAEQAAGLIKDGRAAYNNGAFETAREKHQQALTLLTSEDRDQPHPMAEKARAGLLSAKVRVALSSERFAEAQEHLAQLRRIDDVSPRRLQRLSDETERATAFDSAMDDIDTLVQQGELDQAEQRLFRWQDTALSDPEQQRLDQLKIAIAGQRKQRHVQQVLSQVDRLLSQGRRDDAIDRLVEGRDRYESSKLRDRLDALRQQKRLDELITQAQRAESSGAVSDAIRYYKQALQLEEDPGVQRSLRLLQAQQQIEIAGQHQQVGNLIAARDAYNRALGFAPEGSQAYRNAQKALDDIDRVTERQTLVQMAEDAYDEGNYDVAIRQYKRALEMSGPGKKQQLRQRLTTAKAEQLVEQGDRARQNDNWEKARQLYQQAKALQQDTAGTAQGLEKVEQRLKYQDYLAKGDELRDQGRYSRARVQYRNARDTLRTDEVQQRLEDVRYEYLMLKADEYITREQWRQARSTLLTIRNQVRDTETVRQKLQQVQQKMEEG
jgi:tetratricopeptide (TPR) repeat protein